VLEGGLSTVPAVLFLCLRNARLNHEDSLTARGKATHLHTLGWECRKNYSTTGSTVLNIQAKFPLEKEKGLEGIEERRKKRGIRAQGHGPITITPFQAPILE